MLELTGFRNCGPYLAELVSVLAQSLCALCLTVAYMLKPLSMISYNVLFQLKYFSNHLNVQTKGKIVYSYLRY